MRRTLLAVTMAATFLAPFMPSLALAQESGLKPGFRDMKWDMPPQPGMTKDHVENSVTYYARATDKLAIGDAGLAKILYGFFNNNRLYSVVIVTEKGQGDALLAVLKESWGKGTQPNQYIEKYLWRSGDTMGSYNVNRFTHIAEVMIFNRETLKEVGAADAAIAAKGKKDL